MKGQSFSDWLSDLINAGKKTAYLRVFPLLAGFNKHELLLFSKLLQERHYKKGEYIYQQDYPLAVIYLVQSGSVEVTEDTEAGAQVWLVKQNDFIGIVDMYALDRRKGSAKALEDSRLLAMSKEDFHLFIQKNPGAGVKLLNNACSVLSRQIYQLLEHKSLTGA